MEKKKMTFLVILIVVVLVSLLGTFLYFHEKNKSYYLYLFTGDNEMIKWYYNEDKWYIVNTNEKLNDLFNVYLNGAYKGKYKLAFNDEWYYFDNFNTSIKFEGNTFMINTNYDFESYKYNYNFIQNDSLALSVARNIGIKSDNWTYSLIRADINDLDELKSIYLIDYYIEEDIDSMWTSYSVAFTYNGNKIKIINSVDGATISPGYCSLQLDGVFKFKNDSPKILLSCANFDKLPGEYFLYEYSWNNYNLLIKNDGGK